MYVCNILPKNVKKTEEYITVAQKILRQYNHSLPLDATIMASKDSPITSGHDDPSNLCGKVTITFSYT